jgi:hypothetical protein
MIKPIRISEITEGGITIDIIGGAMDGQEFRLVLADLSDGTTRQLWKSNTHRVLLKQVFVPWDFEHPKIIE